MEISKKASSSARIERELAHFEGSDSDEDITEKLRGLGYIS